MLGSFGSDMGFGKRTENALKRLMNAMAERIFAPIALMVNGESILGLVVLVCHGKGASLKISRTAAAHSSRPHCPSTTPRLTPCLEDGSAVVKTLLHRTATPLIEHTSRLMGDNTSMMS